MFNWAIVRKTFQDGVLPTFVAGTGLVLFCILFVWAMLNMGTELLNFVSSFSFIERILQASLGIDVSGEISLAALYAVGFTHGVVLTLAWGVVIAAATRVTVGEVERGTADLLLTLPVSRLGVYTSASVAWAAAALVVSACPWLGLAIGIWLFPGEEEVLASSYLAPMVNFFALNLAIGGISSLVGCLLDRRAIAVGWVVAIAFVSSVLSFLEPFLDQAEFLRFFSLLNYFRPVDIVREGGWPWTSILCLGTVAAVTWFVGLGNYCRRDIPAA